MYNPSSCETFALYDDFIYCNVKIGKKLCIRGMSKFNHFWS